MPASHSTAPGDGRRSSNVRLALVLGGVAFAIYVLIVINGLSGG